MRIMDHLVWLAVVSVVVMSFASVVLNAPAALSGKKKPLSPVSSPVSAPGSSPISTTVASSPTPSPPSSPSAPLAAFPDAKQVRRVAADSAEGRWVRERIQAVLAQNCYLCHAGNVRLGGLCVDTLQGLLDGGFDDGPAVIPGDIHQGSLLPALRHEGDPAKHMPPGRSLPPEVIADFTRWIADGAPWPSEPNASP